MALEQKLLAANLCVGYTLRTHEHYTKLKVPNGRHLAHCVTTHQILKSTAQNSEHQDTLLPKPRCRRQTKKTMNDKPKSWQCLNPLSDVVT